MAAGTSGTSARSTFPPPPPYYQLFTRDKPAADSDPDDPTVAADIALWTPPPIPTMPYTVFGETIQPTLTPPSLPPDVPLLFTGTNYAASLRTLLSSALTQYTSVLETARTASDSADIQVALTKLTHTLVNITHILTLLRRHQAYIAVVRVLCRATADLDRNIQAKRELINNARQTLIERGIVYEPDRADVRPTSWFRRQTLQNDRNIHTLSTPPHDVAVSNSVAGPTSMSYGDRIAALIASIRDDDAY